MTQILHILKKDFRRFGFEIGLAMALLAFFIWSSPLMWLPPVQFFTTGVFPRYNGPWLLEAVLGMGWIIIMVRLIHEESLAGDRQFWVTRPYEWPALLAAKVLFLLLVVSVPFLAAQMIMLAMAGFPPLHYLAVLLQVQLTLTVIAIPAIALIAVTSGLAQISRMVFLLLLFLAGIWWVNSAVPNRSALHGSSAWDWSRDILLIGIPVIVIVLQYARRRTNHSRLWLVGGALAMLVLIAATPYRRLIEREFPLSPPGEPPIFQLQLHPVAQQSIHSDGKRFLISPELSVGQLAPGYVAEIEAVLVTLQTPDGMRWDSGWHPTYKLLSREMFETQEPGQTMRRGLNAPLEIDSNTFGRMKDIPLKAHVAVAVTLFREEEGKMVMGTQDEFELPGVGICMIRGMPAGALWCRAPLRRPSMVGVTGRMFSSCPPSPAELAATPVKSTGWIVTLPGAREFDLNPVARFIATGSARATNDTYLGMCSGFPVSYRQPQMNRKMRVEADFDDFKISTKPFGQ